MMDRLDDPLSGILMAISACFNVIGIFISPDSIIGNAALVIAVIFIGLFMLRCIRMWKGKEYNPPARYIPILKLIDAALWFFVITIWWNEANNSDHVIGIGMMVIMMIYGAKEVYQAVKLIVTGRK